MLKDKVKAILDSDQVDCREMMFEETYKEVFGLEGIQVKVIDLHGIECMGDEYWTVHTFTDGYDTVSVKFRGWYASYDGAEYTDWSFVEPKEKTTTVWV